MHIVHENKSYRFKGDNLPGRVFKGCTAVEGTFFHIKDLLMRKCFAGRKTKFLALTPYRHIRPHRTLDKFFYSCF